MIKKLIVSCVLMFSLVGCGSSFNVKNDVSENNVNAIHYFQETVVYVKAGNNRVYKVVKDINGWLYFQSSASGELALVYDEDGNITKDISVITGE